MGLRFVLENDANVDAYCVSSTYGYAIKAAAHHGSEKVKRMLLDTGANVNARGGYHGKSSQAAARYSRVKLVHVLLDAGADVNAQGGSYENALVSARQQSHKEVVKVLRRAGARAYHVGNVSLLMESALMLRVLAALMNVEIRRSRAPRK